MALDSTFFQDDSVVVLRKVELPNANFANGMNLGGSNAGGIGINQGGGAIDGRPSQFTLLDQNELPREAQISQSIGGEPYVLQSQYPSSGGLEGTLPDDVIQFGPNPTKAEKDADPALDGTIAATGNSTLSSLAVGWTVNV